MDTATRAREIIAGVLGVPLDRIVADAKADDVAGWDSVAHLNILMAIEQEFGLTLEVEDFAELTSVPAIVARATSATT